MQELEKFLSYGITTVNVLVNLRILLIRQVASNASPSFLRRGGREPAAKEIRRVVLEAIRQLAGINLTSVCASLGWLPILLFLLKAQPVNFGRTIMIQ